MPQSDEDYFRNRANAERELAARASTPAVAAIHTSLARGYDELVRREQRPRPIIRPIQR
jgi:hypothetical protein